MTPMAVSLKLTECFKQDRLWQSEDSVTTFHQVSFHGLSNEVNINTIAQFLFLPFLFFLNTLKPVYGIYKQNRDKNCKRFAGTIRIRFFEA